jgi:protein-S-isoprenylcysteine O-methyltransferase Ste14
MTASASNVTKSDEYLSNGRVTPWMWIGGLFLSAGVTALALFLPAWTLNWPMAWIFIVLSSILYTGSRVIAIRAHPDTMVERWKMLDHADAKQWDRILSLLVGMLGPIAIYILAGLAHRFDWGADVPFWAQLSAMGVYVVSYMIGSWALVANRFFSTVVRMQAERGHTVVSSGPYAVVRHPGYSTAAINYLAMPIILGAYWAIIPAMVTIVLLVIRTILEDRTLRAELPGYEAYTHRTRYRLIPGIW